MIGLGIALAGALIANAWLVQTIHSIYKEKDAQIELLGSKVQTLTNQLLTPPSPVAEAQTADDILRRVEEFRTDIPTIKPLGL